MGRAGGRVELPWGLPQLGFLARLESEPWRAFGFSVCVVYVLGRANMVLYICHILSRETARKVSLVFTSIRTLEESRGGVYSHLLQRMYSRNLCLWGFILK